jgi:hypothetical protein
MSRRHVNFGILLTVGWAMWSSVSSAQQVAVQQPVFQQFAAPTTVLVPDRGGTLLGGVGGGGQAMTMPGPVPLSRGASGNSGSSSVQVRAYVHDFQAMDEALLGTADPPRQSAMTVPAPRRFDGRLTLPPRPPVAHLRADVERAIAEEAAAFDITSRLAAIKQLISIHNRLAVDPRRSQSVLVRGLERRVATRLVEVHGDLAKLVALAPAAQPSPAGQAVVVAASSGGGIAEAQKLIDLIQATVSPEAWDVNGGQSSIRYFANGHALVVRATDDTHDDLGGLLRQLR